MVWLECSWRWWWRCSPPTPRPREPLQQRARLWSDAWLEDTPRNHSFADSYSRLARRMGLLDGGIEEGQGTSMGQWLGSRLGFVLERNRSRSWVRRARSGP